MKYTELGGTGMQISAMCLGTMYFGTKNGEGSSFRLLDQFIDAGGNFIDTANCYAFWIEGACGDESEDLLGRWMKDRKNRDRIVLATKVGARPDRAKGPDYPKNKEGLSADAIEGALEDSLRRLGTEYVDLYYVHTQDPATPTEETLQALDGLVKSGKVRHIGVSNHQAWRVERARQISRAHSWVEYCCIQQRHSYLRPKRGIALEGGAQICVDEELLDYCVENPDVTLLAYSPLLGGAYTRADRPLPEEYRSSDTTARMAALQRVADETGATLNQVVLAWMMQGAPAIIPLIAAGTSSQLEENLGASDVILSPEQMNLLTGTTG